MILVNQTRFPALLFRTILDSERILGSVLVRITYDLAPQLRAAAEQIWQVSPGPWESPAGMMEEDGPFLRGGVDLFVFGRACAPAGVTTGVMPVQIQVGRFVRTAAVSGKRNWVRAARGELQATAPLPFTSIPLTGAHAFGGTAENDGLKIPFPDNAAGKGFHATPQQAEGQELPNLEEPEHLIRRWNDVPPVCGFGFCPRANSARLASGTVRDAKQNILDFRPNLFNQAFTPMVAPAVLPGESVELQGFSPLGKIQFTVPSPAARVRLGFGERVIDRRLQVDQLGVEVDAGRVFVTWRFPFRYVVREREERICHLLTEDK